MEPILFLKPYTEVLHALDKSEEVSYNKICTVF